MCLGERARGAPGYIYAEQVFWLCLLSVLCWFSVAREPGMQDIMELELSRRPETRWSGNSCFCFIEEECISCFDVMWLICLADRMGMEGGIDASPDSLWRGLFAGLLVTKGVAANHSALFHLDSSWNSLCTAARQVSRAWEIAVFWRPGMHWKLDGDPVVLGWLGFPLIEQLLFGINPLPLSVLMLVFHFLSHGCELLRCFWKEKQKGKWCS